MNKKLSSEAIARIFLDFFEEYDHLRIEGASLIPKNDPTLLFINSGMAPLKKYFVGEERPPKPDLCNVQPCIRTIDIDDVGDRHHLTLFEMLGSWSIDHYFKERAVELAFELLVERYGFPASHLYASVYRGNPSINLPPDDESAKAWEKVGLPNDHIVFLGQDNFWGPAGETGPCGPCTEVFFDTGEEHGPAYRPGEHFDSDSRYIEIWNAGVFMEFNKTADGSFVPLPFKSVDTGSGLERMGMALNGHETVYEVDVLRAVMESVRQQFGASDRQVRAARIMTDHLRASFFILAEGVLPSNEGRGYIPRRLIRKCLALAKQAGAADFGYRELLHQIADQFAGRYPHVDAHRQRAIQAFLREKEKFDHVVSRGLDRLEALCSQSSPHLSGADAFQLFATYGLPVELIREFVREREGSFDEAEFAAEFQKHQEVSRVEKASGDGHVGLSDLDVPSLLPEGAPTDFVGYEKTEGRGTILGLIRGDHAVESAEAGAEVDVVVDSTPFYAEAGGQVGDQGVMETSDGAVVRVEDCVKDEAGFYLHRACVQEGEIRRGDSVLLKVDADRRLKIKANHSATHLLQSALRELLGKHVRQRGSLVDDHKLRFDFDHPSRVEPDEIAAIERRVNQNVRANFPAGTSVSGYREAVDQGVLAFFGDTYGERVRVVRFGSVSAELCGGTHVDSTGEIGLFRVVSEGSIAGGIRRITAITGDQAVAHDQHQDQLLRSLASRLGVGVESLPERIEKLMDNAAKASKAEPAKVELSLDDHTRELPGGVQCLCARVDETPDVLRKIIFEALARVGVACLVSVQEDKVRVALAVNDSLSDKLDANRLLRDALPLVDGKGGGNRTFAQGGGHNPAGVDKLVAEFPSIVQRHLSA